MTKETEINLEQIKPFDYELHLSERVDSIEEIKHEDDNFWKVKTTEEKEFFSKNIFIAAGAGSFEPRRPPNIEDPDKFLTNGVEYAVRSVDKYKDKNIFIFGGGDSALDWTVELSKIAKSVSLVHRSCLLYTSPSPRDMTGSRMPSSA